MIILIILIICYYFVCFQATYSTSNSSFSTAANLFTSPFGSTSFNMDDSDLTFRDSHLGFFLDDSDMEMENLGSTPEGAAILESLGNSIFGNGASDALPIPGNCNFSMEEALLEIRMTSGDRFPSDSEKQASLNYPAPSSSTEFTETRASNDHSPCDTAMLLSAHDCLLKDYSRDCLSTIAAVPCSQYMGMDGNISGVTPISSSYQTYPANQSVNQFPHPASSSKYCPDLEELWDYFSYCQTQSSTGGMNQLWRSRQHQGVSQPSSSGTRFWFPTEGKDRSEGSRLKGSQQSSFDDGMASPLHISSPTLRDSKADARYVNNLIYFVRFQNRKSHFSVVFYKICDQNQLV